jgi:N-acylglucosamine-6-phosphate 2-epimerase
LTLRRALRKADDGADIVATTLCGYADETAHLKPPDFSLLRQLTRRLSVPVICKGGISSPEQARQAMD